MTEEVKRLCNEIKRLVPPKQAQYTTGPFDDFMKVMKDKITPQELESIHRAYNYFNRLVTLDLNTPIVAQSKDAGSGAKKNDGSGAGSGDESGAKKNEGAGSGAKKNEGAGSGAGGTEAGNPINETTTKEMITILVELMKLS